jgi:hypothetical protein
MPLIMRPGPAGAMQRRREEKSMEQAEASAYEM